jgi:hypothetical protein
VSSSFFSPIRVIYSARKRERRRILAQGCKKLSHDLWVLEERCRRLLYELQASWEKEVQRRCGYHLKVYTQVVSTTCLFEILINHYFHTVLLEKGVSNNRILKA